MFILVAIVILVTTFNLGYLSSVECPHHVCDGTLGTMVSFVTFVDMFALANRTYGTQPTG
jgi:hypothetical protein